MFEISKKRGQRNSESGSDPEFLFYQRSSFQFDYQIGEVFKSFIYNSLDHIFKSSKLPKISQLLINLPQYS